MEQKQAMLIVLNHLRYNRKQRMDNGDLFDLYILEFCFR